MAAYFKNITPHPPLCLSSIVGTFQQTLANPDDVVSNATVPRVRTDMCGGFWDFPQRYCLDVPTDVFLPSSNSSIAQLKIYTTVLAIPQHESDKLKSPRMDKSSISMVQVHVRTSLLPKTRCCKDQKEDVLHDNRLFSCARAFLLPLSHLHLKTTYLGMADEPRGMTSISARNEYFHFYCNRGSDRSSQYLG